MKYTYPFQFNLDYQQILESAIALSEYQVRHARTGFGKGYRKAEEGEEITHWACKLCLSKDKRTIDNPHKIFIENQCKKVMDAVGSKKYDLILVEYDSESYLDWHIDNGPTRTEDYGRINIVVTEDWENTPIIFKDNEGNEIPCPAKIQAVNTYREEHKYDNRGKEKKRILLIMTTEDKNYDEVVEAIKGFSV